jgi:hypothetical protein
MAAIYNPFGSPPSVPLAGVPQIPDGVARKLIRGCDECLTDADMAACDEAIARAKAEIDRRHWLKKQGAA